MNITCNEAQGRVPVTVFGLSGALDGSNFRELIARGQEAYASGTRRILIDLSDLTFMSSAGLVALHALARVLCGEPLPDLEDGWGAFHALGRAQEGGLQPCLKLLKPQPKVERVLRTSGMDAFFEIHVDMEQAIESF